MTQWKLALAGTRPAAFLPIVALVVGACGAAASPGPSGPPNRPVSGTSVPATSTPIPSPSPSPTPSPTPPSLPGSGTWRQLAPGAATPAPREAHSWTVDPLGRMAYLFGGRDGGTVFGDLWRFDLATGRWSKLAPAGRAPAARFGQSAVWLAGRGLLIFAGQSSGGFFNDLWLYDPAMNAWSKLPGGGDPPIPRYGSCAVVGADGRLWVSHGFTEERIRFADTRAYDFAAGTWADVTPPGEVPIARCLHSCFLTDDGRFVLYAGQTTGVPALGDLWALTPGPGTAAGTWREVKGTLPPPRQLYASARVGDGATTAGAGTAGRVLGSEAIVIFGGGSLDKGYLADMWIISAADLTAAPLPTIGGLPPARSAAAFVADPDAPRLLLFGGRDADGAFSDVWMLELQ